MPPARRGDASAALLRSVARDNFAGVASAIQSGADVESLHHATGETALMIAGRLGNVKIMDLLLQSSSSLSSTNRRGYTALHLASLDGISPVVQLLLRAGASVSTRTTTGETPLLSASLSCRKDAIELLLGAGAEADAQDENGRSALMWVAMQGSASLVTTLLGAGADHGLEDSKGGQALHYATQQGQLAAMSSLIEAGASIISRRSHCELSDNALHIAVQHNHPAAVGLLLRAGAQAMVKRDDGMTALHIAVVKQAPVLVLDLLRFFEQQDDDAAASAASSGNALTHFSPPPPEHHPPQRRRAKPAGAPHMRDALSSRTELGFTPLHIATAFGKTRIVDALLQRGALETEKDGEGNSPFQHPVSAAAGDSICVEVDGRDVVLGKDQAGAIVRSLSRGPAFRARSWCWPDAAAVAAESRRRPRVRRAAIFLPVRAAPGGGKKGLAHAFRRYAVKPSTARELVPVRHDTQASSWGPAGKF
ncbi:unnamed protein product [Scytosiphon promiscuus]